jgi:hypothetical protein
MRLNPASAQIRPTLDGEMPMASAINRLLNKSCLDSDLRT